jgi:glycosyltransferase involved in cell wall biosynthesis
MRILTFTSLFPNSMAENLGTFLLQRTLHLATRQGNDVQVVSPLPYVPAFLRNTSRGKVAAVSEVETIAGLTVHHPRYPLIPQVSMPLHGALMYAGCLSRIRALHSKHSFDCIDGHYVFPDGLAAVMLGKALNIPVTLTARGSDIHTFPAFTTIRPQIRWALRNASAVSAVSNSLADAMMILESTLSSVEVIGNGVDAKRFFPEERAVARKKIGIGEGDKLIVSVAALRKVKGPDLLVRAAALLTRDEPNLKVLFVGEGEELENLRQLATQLGCADECRFVGAVANADLRRYYAAADVSCLASRNEGWPNVVLESLACGTPVVGTSVGAVAEILSSATHGLVVEPTPESICKGLRQALAVSWDKETLVSYAQSQSWDKVADRVEDFLRRSIQQELPEFRPAVLA